MTPHEREEQNAKNLQRIADALEKIEKKTSELIAMPRRVGGLN